LRISARCVRTPVSGPHGSRRAASGAPHHEGLISREPGTSSGLPDSHRNTRPHPEEPANGGRLEGWRQQQGRQSIAQARQDPGRPDRTLAATPDLILRSPPAAGVSKDGRSDRAGHPSAHSTRRLRSHPFYRISFP
jgi:hypothetical protein